MDTTIVIKKVKKLSPKKDDIICLHFEENIFNGDYDVQLEQLGKKLKNECPNVYFIMLPEKADITLLKDKDLQRAGLKRI